MKKIPLVATLILLSYSSLFAQVVISTDNSDVDPSAMLNITSDNKGLLPPRMTHEKMNQIANPKDGLIVFCTDCPGLYIYLNTMWNRIAINCDILTPGPGTQVPSNNQIVWNWNNVANAAGYKWGTANDYLGAQYMGTTTTMTQTGLSCNTAYSSYAWAYNACGRSEPVTLSQSTLPCSPTVTTDAATGMTSNAATLNGTVNANGLSTTVTFEYGQTTAYGSTVPAAQSPVTGTTPTAVSTAITSLTPNTMYHFRVVGTSSGGSTNGADLTFTTLPLPPDVITTAATGVTNNSATLNGTVNANGASTDVTFQYGLTTAYGPPVAATPSPVAGNTTTPVSAGISGLTQNTLYHYRIVGASTGGTTNGNDMNFTTACDTYVPVSVSITPSANPSCQGSQVTFTATATNGGSSPAYQWKVNGTNAGTNTATYAYAPANGDVVTCVLTSNATCVSGNTATSNPVTMTVNSPPAAPAAGSASATQNQIVWNWNSVSGATNYKWNSENNYASATDMGNTTSTTETGLFCNTQYPSFVWAVGSCGPSSATALPQTTTSACSSSTVTVGTGSSTCYYPYTTNWMDGRTQMLYSGLELATAGGGPGMITSIGFNVISADLAAMNGFTISMMNTNLNSISNWVNSGLTTCYQQTYTVPGTGWWMITLTNPFYYDGTNLLIQVCYHNTAYTNYSPVYGSSAPGMIYYYMMNNSNGCGLAGSYSTTVRPNLQFTEQPSSAIVTINPTNIAQTTATSGGNIISAGGSTVTARGVCWSTLANPTISDNHTSDGSGPGVFTSSLTGLSVYTLYHIRAYATTSAGITSYGNDLTFTTLLNFYTIGNGNTTCYYPYTTAWKDGRTQMLYSEAELAASGISPGLIVSIGLNVISADPIVMNGFYIRLMNTSMPAITGWVNSMDMTEGYSGTYSVPGTGWQMITLGTPFVYDGTNLLIEICYGNSSYNSYSPVYGSTAAGMINYFYQNLSSGSGCDLTNTYSTTVRPNLQLGQQPMHVLTDHISGISQTIAVGGGTVTPDGGPAVIARGVCWSTSSPPYITDSHTSDGSDNGSFISNITGLTPGTLYHVRAYATNNSAITSYGNEVTFTTRANSTTITIGSGTTNCQYPYITSWKDGRTQMLFTAEEISSYLYSPGLISDIGFNVITANSIVMSGFNVSLMNTTMSSITGWVNSGMTNCYSGTYSVAGTGWQLIHLGTPFVYDGTNLLIQICYDNSSSAGDSPVYGSTSGGMIYYYCNNNPGGCSLTGSYSTTVRPNLQLVEQQSLPILTTPATNILQTTATSGGNILSDGGSNITERGVCWSTSVNPRYSDNHISNGNGTGIFTINLTGLSPWTLYHIRAYATNSAGTWYGGDLTFTTLGYPPTVTTTAVTNISTNAATSGGNVTSDGGGTVTARGVCWGISANPDINGVHTSDGTGNGSFVSYLNGLTANTTYYVCAYATNSAGTAYGSILQFKTATLLFTETFESASVGQTPPAGWGVDPVNGTNYTWFQSSGTNPACTPPDGSRMVEFQSYSAASGVENRLKRTTPVSTVVYSNIAVDFKWSTDWGYSGSADRVNVQWSTDGTTWTTAATVNRYAANAQTWTTQTILPSGAAGQATLYIAFDFISADGNNCHLDMVHITGVSP